jgi:hypothetical protein
VLDAHLIDDHRADTLLFAWARTGDEEIRVVFRTGCPNPFIEHEPLGIHGILKNFQPIAPDMFEETGAITDRPLSEHYGFG